MNKAQVVVVVVGALIIAVTNTDVWAMITGTALGVIYGMEMDR